MFNKNLIFVVTGIVVALIVGYSLGDSYGYKRAQADIKKLELASAEKSAEEVGKAVNPFGVVNPLEGVEANPFEKAKKVLNPFN